jgi:general secretion pathway protein H
VTTRILPAGFSEMRKGGFTLVEVLVVLTIVALVVSSISYVVFNGNNDLQSVSREIVQSIKLVQQRSIREDKPYQIEIDLNENSISFPEKLVEIPSAYSVTVKTAANQVIEDKLVGMTFYPDASSTGGSILLESDQEEYQIVVVWISGKIQTSYRQKTT